jgi:hypothetical protein
MENLLSTEADYTRNVMAAWVREGDSSTRIITEVNIPGVAHSEGVFADKLKGKTVIVEALFSERIPCRECSSLLGTQKRISEAAIYYTIPEIWTPAMNYRPRTDALMTAYKVLRVK